MSRIIRTDANKILAKAVEYHGFVYLQGVVAADLTKGIKRLLQAHIWLKDIGDRAAMNEVWSAWLPADGAPARACVQAVLADPDYLVEIMVTACR
jgi:enamine deaminase RidA (YjgF/YER057c/UK114 family)